MKPHAVALAFAILTLGACDKPKMRPVPVDPMAVVVAPVVVAAADAAAGALSVDLPRRAEFPGFYLDRVGAALDPLNRQPAVISGGEPIALEGFGFDPVGKVPAKGVDVVIDGKAYGTQYGHDRPDVAQYNKIPALKPTGFRTALPAGTLAKGPHSVTLRVIGADGAAYYESPSIAFVVN